MTKRTQAELAKLAEAERQAIIAKRERSIPQRIAAYARKRFSGKELEEFNERVRRSK